MDRIAMTLAREAEETEVEFDGRRLRLTNLRKVADRRRGAAREARPKRPKRPMRPQP